MSTISERYKELRQTLHLTQKEFSERILVSPSYISKVESGKEIPSDILIKLTALEFDISYNWLHIGEGEVALKKEILDYFARPDKEIYAAEISKDIEALINSLRGLDSDFALNITVILHILTGIFEMQMKTTAQKRLLIDLVSSFIVRLEEIIRVCNHTDISDNIAVFKTAEYFKKNHDMFSDLVNDIRNLFLSTSE